MMRLSWQILKWPLLAVFAYLSLVLLYFILYRVGDSNPQRYFAEPLAAAQAGRVQRASGLQQRPTGAEVLTFYALGDWGTASADQQRVAALLRDDVAGLGDRVRAPFVLEAGDNVYLRGLKKGWDNPVLRQQLADTFGDMYAEVMFQGRALDYHLVNGNHDHYGDVNLWESYAEGRYNDSRRGPRLFYYNRWHASIADTNDEAEYLALQASTHMLSFPETVEVASDLVNIIAIDSEFLLHAYTKRDNSPQLQQQIQQYWQHLGQLVAASDAPWTLLMAHHPISSFGPHGGYPAHLALLMDVLTLWLGNQDLHNEPYKMFIEDFNAFAAAQDKLLLYLAGHEHSLQLNRVSDNLIQVVSGAAGQRSAVGHGDNTLYSYSALGFVRLDATERELWLQFMDVEADPAPVLYRLTR